MAPDFLSPRGFPPPGPFPAAPEGLADLPAPACPGVHGLSRADSRALEVESLTDPEKGAEAWDVFFRVFGERRRQRRSLRVQCAGSGGDNQK